MNNTSNTVKVCCIDHNRRLQILNTVATMKRTDIKALKLNRKLDL